MIILKYFIKKNTYRTSYYKYYNFTEAQEIDTELFYKQNNKHLTIENLEESKKVHLITEKIITFQEKLTQINTKPKHYSETEQIRRKLQQLEGLLLKELEYIFYNITPPKLAKEKLSGPNE
ncbi:15383_t:CDS:1, partial [Racocetra persica]